MYKITLKAARINAGLQSQEVAEMMGVTKQTMVNWEKGKNKLFAEQLIKLCEIYKTPIEMINLDIERKEINNE